ncbi:4804_t:CDS:2, partial [Cetraspora pellucida]
HPIWTYFASNDLTKTYICLQYKNDYSYPKSTNESKLKNYFMIKYSEIWNFIKKNKRGCKKKTKQLTFHQEVSSPIEATYESVVQFQDQITNDNQISIHENTNSIQSVNTFNIINNIKSIEVNNSKKIEIEFEYNKILVTENLYNLKMFKRKQFQRERDSEEEVVEKKQVLSWSLNNAIRDVSNIKKSIKKLDK